MSTTLETSPSLVRASIVTHHMHNAPSVSGRHLGDGLHLFGGAHSIQDMPSPSAPLCAPDLDEAHLRLQGPQPLSSSSSFPSFPSNTDIRSPPAIASTPSPSDTPPFATNTTCTASSSASSTTQPASFVQSPWHALAATGGAMTPSLDGGPTLAPRGSPQLGRPFEKLNLGGAWSASNLREDSTDLPPRAPRSSVPTGAVSGEGIVMSPHKSLQAPIALSSLAQRRALGASMSLGPLRGGGGQPATPSPLTGPPSTSSSLSASTSASGSTSSTRLKPLAPSALPSLVGADSTLILDIRPPSSFHDSHLPNAHSIPVPSTLLRRPNFGIAKLCQMLATPSRDAVGRWRDKADIVIVDQDSTVALEGCVLLGLTGKFEREGFAGKLWFVSGGQAAVEDQDCVECVCDGPADANPTPPPGNNASLGIGRLPRLAFQQCKSHGKALLTAAASTGGTRGFTTAATNRADPFQLLKLPGGSAPATGRRPPRSSESLRTRLQPANPFFDNIRQNLELSHGGITERISLALPDNVKRRASELPKFLRKLVDMKDNESQDLLADQFYRIELGEQKRLQGIMDILTQGTCTPASALSVAHNDMTHSADDIEQLMANGTDQSVYYPFSITAGVERGAKNRYKNIWPYDFSRVRLGSPTEDNSDYINASFVQPRGTTRRYIATQGPLDATYRDFWTLVWEQNVRIIVMLTKQFEGGLLKCGNYWQEHQYGDIHLRLVSHAGGEDDAEQVQTGFDFGNAAAETSKPDGNIHRTFHLWHNRFPNQAPRVITQIQCVDWPDFDVPDSPEVLLNLIKEVDQAVAKTGLTGCGEDRCTFPPVLVHCSAGVGRTGSYILVDAISDGLRQEIRSGKGKDASSTSPALNPTIKSHADSNTVPFADDTAGRGDKMDIDAVVSSKSGTESPEPEKPRPITQSHRRHRPATPLSSMKEPILEVLQGMRVQRMSLVQSLRQYLFVHRAVIANYLEMVDEESRRRSSASDTLSFMSQSSAATAATAATSIPSTDDEAHIKRKPSSADLQPEVDLRLQSVAELRLSDGAAGAVNLAKRASFKKRRGPNASSVPGTPHRQSSAGSAELVSPPISGGNTTLPSPPLPPAVLAARRAARSPRSQER